MCNDYGGRAIPRSVHTSTFSQTKNGLAMKLMMGPSPIRTENDFIPSIAATDDHARVKMKTNNFAAAMDADDETASTASMSSVPSSVFAGPSTGAAWRTTPPSSAEPASELETMTTSTLAVQRSDGRDGVGIRRIPSSIRLAILSLNREQVVWEEIEDDLFILLDGNFRCFQLLQTLYFQAGLTRSEILRSLAYLSTSSCNVTDMTMHDEHVSRLAYFLCTGRTPQRLKLAALETLLQCLGPSLDYSTNRAMQTIRVENTYEFLTTRTKEWDHLDQTTIPVIYELRAKCLRELDLERERIRRVTDKADKAAVLIATGAKLVELGIQQSNKMIEGHIDSAGRKVKGWVDVESRPLMADRDAVVAVAFSDSARRMSQYAQESTKHVMRNICDASISGLRSVGSKLDQGTKFGEQIPPEALEVVKAAGKVGLAAVGATALVGEAIAETGRRLASKTASVTADIVEHKYGRRAGKVAKNMGETAGNVLRTMGNIALLERSVMAKSVAKTVGKDQLEKDVQKVKETIQMLERHLAKRASQSLGIEWNREWIKEIDEVFDLEGCVAEKMKLGVARSCCGLDKIKSKVQSVSEDNSDMVCMASSEEEHSSCDDKYRSLANLPRAPHLSSRGETSDQPYRHRYPLIQFV
jgi:hypothetical protein